MKHKGRHRGIELLSASACNDTNNPRLYGHFEGCHLTQTVKTRKGWLEKLVFC